MIFSISWRARTQVSSVDLMAPSSAEPSTVSRARSAAMAAASGGASLAGQGPSLSICDLTAASCGRSASAVWDESPRIDSTSMRSRPSSSSSSVKCWMVFSAASMALVSRATPSATSDGSATFAGVG